MPLFIRVLIVRHWSALKLQLRPHDTPLTLAMQAILLLGHGVGWLVIVRLSHNNQWFMLLPLLLILPAFIIFKTRQSYAWLETLAPMLVVYGILGVRLLLSVEARRQGQEFVLEPPLSNLLNINSWVIISLVWVGAAQVGLVAQVLNRSLSFQRSIQLLSLIIIVGTLLWAAMTYFDMRTRGVTASDPYAYGQMGYDLATTGSLEHEFALVELTEAADLDAYALIPIGYLTPDTTTQQGTTVWSPGYSVFLAGAYLLLGETGFYLLTPLMGIFTLLALLWLLYELLPDLETPYRELASAVSMLILATSLLQVVWLLLPMADIPAQLFSTLAIVFVLRIRHSNGRELSRSYSDMGNGFLAGLCLGLAFAIRYTQVLMGVPMLYGLFWIFILERKDWRQGLKVLLATGGGAWLVAGLVFWYHTVAFGHPLKVGSEELMHFGLENLSLTIPRVWNDLLVEDEFLWMLPFLLWGVYRLLRSYRQPALILGLWVGALLAFHLPYHYLKLRDLLSVFPVLAMLVGVGVADMLRTIQQLDNQRRRGWLMLGLLVLSLVTINLRLRTTPKLDKDTFTNFGYLSADQRASFAELAQLTPENAIIGVSLNGGAVMLHSERAIVRPYEWSDDEWFRFVKQAHQENYVIYLLVEGVDMESVYTATAETYTVEPVDELEMPYFYFAGGSTSQLVTLYVIHTKTQE